MNDTLLRLSAHRARTVKYISLFFRALPGIVLDAAHMPCKRECPYSDYYRSGDVCPNCDGSGYTWCLDDLNVLRAYGPPHRCKPGCVLQAEAMGFTCGWEDLEPWDEIKPFSLRHLAFSRAYFYGLVNEVAISFNVHSEIKEIRLIEE